MRHHMMLSSSSVAGEVVWAQDNDETNSGFLLELLSGDNYSYGVDGDYFYWTCTDVDNRSSGGSGFINVYRDIYNTSGFTAPNDGSSVDFDVNVGDKLRLTFEQDWHNESDWTANGLLDNQLYRYALTELSGYGATTVVRYEHAVQYYNNNAEVKVSPAGEVQIDFTLQSSSTTRIQFWQRYRAYYEEADVLGQGKTLPYFGTRIRNAKIIKPFDQS